MDPCSAHYSIALYVVDFQTLLLVFHEETIREKCITPKHIFSHMCTKSVFILNEDKIKSLLSDLKSQNLFALESHIKADTGGGLGGGLWWLI